MLERESTVPDAAMGRIRFAEAIGTDQPDTHAAWTELLDESDSLGPFTYAEESSTRVVTVA